MCVAGAAARCSSLRLGDAREAAIEAVEARLKFLLQIGEHAVLQAP